MMKIFYFSILLLCVLYADVSAQGYNRAKGKWYVPDFLVAQYAGSIGFISGGFGYDVLKKKGKLDLLGGYVPGFTGSAPMETITLKFSASLIKVYINPRFVIHPLNTGLYFCYTPGVEFSSNLPAWYPEGYYWWSEAVRANLFIGGDATFYSDWLKRDSRLGVYYEIGTNEIKLVSYAQNRRGLNIWTILHAGIGVRYHFAKK